MLLFAGSIFTCFLATAFADPIISIKQGQLNGTVLKSRNGKPFFAFYGIPYAEPPVGKLRFAPPHKAPTWEGLRNAIEKAPVCIQPQNFIDPKPKLKGLEDCLYLSVFTPEINNSSKLLPVMVYIHGGAYFTGSGDKGPNFLMDKPIVVVTMNYRHGILGFLSSNDAIIPGNYALKDQVAALRWIKSNIASFGGNPNAVTILGQSSGSTCVHLHTMSPLSKGLFHRAIMQSGSAMSYWSHYDPRYAKRSFDDVMKKVNCTQNTTLEILHCLRQLPAEDLIQAEQYFRAEKRIVMKFRPVIEKRRVKNAFMTVSPRKLTYQNISVPWIMGFNSAEGMMDAIWFLSKSESQKKRMNKELNAVMPLFLHYKYFSRKENVANITTALKKFYFKNGNFNETDQQQLCNLISDIVFGMPSLQAAYAYPGPKYFYYYDFVTNSTAADIGKMFFNTSKKYDIKGAVHSDEMDLLFVGRRPRNLPEEKYLSEKLIAYWTNFIITGNPNSADLPVWNQLQPDTGDYLHITNDRIEMEKGLLRDRYELWKHINNL